MRLFISFIALLLVAANAHAGCSVNDLIGVGLKAAQAEALDCTSLEPKGTFTIKDTSGNSIFQVQSDGDVLGSDGTDGWALLTATNDVQLVSNTADGSDDHRMTLSGGGARGSSRGGFVDAQGNEHTGAGDVVLGTGNAANSDVLIYGLATNSDVTFLQDDANTENFQIQQSGVWASAAGLDLGLEYVTGANTACTTTCAVADGGVLFGVDLAAGASSPVIVEADDATADACLCLELRNDK